MKAPKDERPTLGRVRQTLFDILAAGLGGTRFLDLFAGSGAVGIEALSRGAERATFIEANPYNADLIRENLLRCGFSEMGEVICAEVERALPRLAQRGEQFQIAFLDPPYQDLASLERALKILAEGPDLLFPGGMIIVQRSRRKQIEGSPSSLEVFDSRSIGESALDFFRKRE
ncbi:MAG: 16S rRNA (guanine(966)-N(2))-methyltransferase RsmD [Armatimonadetes bacterium]|nr:16S rRNA (guanine(966)-N(2))-methyltransferase RsmD [Armatimonadota bacterium]NIM24910.1 16S rRNA (guanine(966)-N(2))-methyltransferase RsmD [Armatimonadota bacterium]NIM68803.1 16S rRNA (guanine(966)-N(2))-methyltransferase RsmD [Armatimonadota bacterium]NIN06232.1 16S rRNA (guanine(966)-N(2))-methyltransferase RsmD [Armatimonadota bacterium]NIO98938.1 16S rRNA (guanine(966)-N(2))-methyltransferase RsmD [Armatimonadota bacterium]